MTCHNCRIECKRHGKDRKGYQRYQCHQCRKPIELSWNLCPYCGTPAPGVRRENATMDDVTRPAPIVEEAQPEETATIPENGDPL